MLQDPEIDRLRHAAHGDPFAVLGVHADEAGRLCLRVMLPGAAQVAVLDASNGELLGALKQRHADGFFEGVLNAAERPNYRLQVRWDDGNSTIVDDPYRFPPVLGELDIWLLGEGSHLRPFEVLGAAQRVMLGVAGTSFAVWAPNASQVSVVGDFNLWDARRHPMRLRRECGVWEIFLPGVGAGAKYKYQIRARDGRVLPQKADPYALQSELRPATASVVGRMPSVVPKSDARQRANALDAPVSIYEVHLGSWRRHADGSNDGNGRWLNWDELASGLVPYARDMGFTHIELMPVSEHPFDGSWGYQPIGLYAPTSRFGDAAGFRRFVDRCHAEGLGLLLDWVPAHFPSDAHGLAEFDGSHLYEYADPREGFHQDWNTLIYNFGRTEVSNFMVANALYWLERYNVDGLRVDAVASMLYLDYSRKDGQWSPNKEGGNTNLEAVAFLRRVNELVYASAPGAQMIAEESTAWPGVSQPVYAGGLGFGFKWNMGWMNDTLSYMAEDPVHRRWHHNRMSFGLMYAFSENFVLPISHDEVVHGKGSMIGKMPGDTWQKFANLRAFYAFMWAHPGKKLLFMGQEFGQFAEWNFRQSLDWHLLDQHTPGHGLHQGLQSLLRDLNQLYRHHPALHARDCEAEGFDWISADDAEQSVFAWLRYAGEAPPIAMIANLTPVPRQNYRVGLPRTGRWREIFNSDAAVYGGSGTGNLGAVVAGNQSTHGKPASAEIFLPPLATIFLMHEAE